MMLFMHMQQMLEAQKQDDHIGMIVARQHDGIADGAQTADPGAFRQPVQHSFVQDMICNMMA